MISGWQMSSVPSVYPLSLPWSQWGGEGLQHCKPSPSPLDPLIELRGWPVVDGIGGEGVKRTLGLQGTGVNEWAVNHVWPLTSPTRLVLSVPDKAKLEDRGGLVLAELRMCGDFFQHGSSTGSSVEQHGGHRSNTLHVNTWQVGCSINSNTAHLRFHDIIQHVLEGSYIYISSMDVVLAIAKELDCTLIFSQGKYIRCGFSIGNILQHRLSI